MFKRLTLKFVKDIRYNRYRKKTMKLFRDRKGNLYQGYSKLTAKPYKTNENL